MFKNLPSSLGVRKSVWTPSTVIASVAIHAAVLGAVYSSVNAADEAEKKENEEQLVMLEIKPEPPKPPEPPPPPPPPPPPEPEPEPEPEPKPKPKAPRPVVPPTPQKPAPKPQVAKGTQTLKPPVKPPIGIPAEDRNARAVNPEDFSGKGKEGGVAEGSTTGVAMATTEKVKAAPPAPPAPPVEKVDSSNFVYDAGSVGTPAGLSDSGKRDMIRLLERNYPANLRDSGVTGQAVMQFVVDENGRVEASTIKVMSATHDAFGDASRDVLRQARFTPARVGSRKVRMMLQLPITWAVSR